MATQKETAVRRIYISIHDDTPCELAASRVAETIKQMNGRKHLAAHFFDGVMINVETTRNGNLSARVWTNAKAAWGTNKNL